MLISPGLANSLVKGMQGSDLQINFKKNHPNAVIPERARKGDVGFDLRAVEYATIYSGGDVVPIDTGISIELPDNMFALVAPRSGLGIKGMIIHGGIIDSGYRGNIMVIASKNGKGWIEFAPGDKIAQLILLPCYSATFNEKEDLSTTERGSKGFGSTDANKN